MKRNKVYIHIISPTVAANDYPGSITADIAAGLLLKRFQTGYLTLGTLDHVLLARVESYNGVHVTVDWRVWTGSDWQDMAVVNPELLHRLQTLPVGW